MQEEQKKKIKPSFLTVSINYLGYTTWIKYIQIASLLHTIIFFKEQTRTRKQESGFAGGGNEGK